MPILLRGTLMSHVHSRASAVASLALAASLLDAAVFLAQGPGAKTTAAAAPIRIPFEKYTLPSGLTVVLAPDHSTPRVTVATLYHVGSKNEQAGRTGFAHLFEHMMFTGS